MRAGPLYNEKEPRMKNSLERATSILNEYFSEFKEGVPTNWELGDGDGGYLCTNNGIVALIMVLKEVINHIEKVQGIQVIDLSPNSVMAEIKQYIQPIIQYFVKASYDEIKQYRRQVGSSGQRLSSLGMMELINLEFNNFNPEGLEKYIREKDSNWNLQARSYLVPKIQLLISNDVIASLQKEFGENGENWWYQGVPETVRVKVVQRQERDPEHRRKEENFDLIHYKDIIKNNWTLFKVKYGFTEFGNNKDTQMSWFDRLSKIRNTVSHPERGTISEDDYNFLVKLYDDLEIRLQ